jgi:hypothetical protein
MILEYSQLLSTAHRVLDGKMRIELSSSGRKIKRWALSNVFLDKNLYKATHMNHPSAIWARESMGNYYWLQRLLFWLCQEYTHRYKKIHKVESSGLLDLLYEYPTNIPRVSITTCPLAMPDIYKIEGNVVESYRNFYNKSKSRFATWKVRSTPTWYNPTL